jgi:hypothetical protein
MVVGYLPFVLAGVRPLDGVPLPRIRVCVQGERPNCGSTRSRTGSAKAGWLSALKASAPNSTEHFSAIRKGAAQGQVDLRHAEAGN